MIVICSLYLLQIVPVALVLAVLGHSVYEAKEGLRCSPVIRNAIAELFLV